MSVKETNAQKIARFYTISKVNKRYQEPVEKHKQGLITDWEFIFECEKIYSTNWRKCFISLEEWKNDGTK